MSREKLVKQLQDKAKRYIKEIEEHGPEIMEEAIIYSFTHQVCNSLETQKLGGFSIFAPDGDEEVCSLLFCEKCQVYYLDCYHDQFMVNGDFIFQKHITPEEAEVVKEAVSKCENSFNKYCRCKHHEKLGQILYRDFMEFLKQEMIKKRVSLD